MKILGIVFILMGITMTVCTGFNYVTNENIVEMGSAKISKEKNHPLQWKPIIGLMIIVGGVIIIEDSNRKKRRS
ncbi:MAG: hypothetical protein H7Y10_01455 [Flavobacterium sp.]|nr:hypothetical protein [Flavobacterium sp.]